MAVRLYSCVSLITVKSCPAAILFGCEFAALVRRFFVMDILWGLDDLISHEAMAFRLEQSGLLIAMRGEHK